MGIEAEALLNFNGATQGSMPDIFVSDHLAALFSILERDENSGGMAVRIPDDVCKEAGYITIAEQLFAEFAFSDCCWARLLE